MSPLSRSIGVAIVQLPAEWQRDSSLHALMFTRSGTGQWRESNMPLVVDVRGSKQLRSSIVEIQPNTTVDVRVTIMRDQQSDVVLEGSSRTLSETLPSANGATFYVSATGSGTLYTRDRPGALRQLFSDGLPCNSTVILLEGTYEDAYDMTLNITNDCTAESPIVIKAEPSRKVTLTGEVLLNSGWEQTVGDSTEWSCPLSNDLAFTALIVSNNGRRFYPYALRTPNNILPGYPSLKDLGYDLPGFYRANGRLFVRDSGSTANSTLPVRSSLQWSCLTVNGNNKRAFVLFYGITFSFFGNTRCDKNIFGIPDACYPPFTLAFNDVNDVTVANCFFEYTNFPIAFNGACSNIDIRNNEIDDGVGTWSHGAFKQTRDISPIDLGSYGRYLENGGIRVSPGDGDSIANISIHGNRVSGTIVGISVGSNATSYLVDNVDIYNNDVDWCYDGIDITGGNTSGATNARIRNNRVMNCPVGTSLILPTSGPYLITRNTYFIADRKNHNNDVFFVTCNNTITDRSWTTALKLNAGGENTTPGTVMFIHNTVIATGRMGYGLYLWNPTWSLLIALNNIVIADAAPWMFDGIRNFDTYSLTTNANVYHSPITSTIATIRPVHGQPECFEASSLFEFEVQLSAVTRSRRAVVGFLDMAQDPFLADIQNGDVRLSPGSPIIDKATRLPGLNDSFEGAGPDPGAFESPFSTSVFDSPLPQTVGTSSTSDGLYDVSGRRFQPGTAPTGLYFNVLRHLNGSVTALPVFIVR
ncbi:MAG: hypothetical protein H7X70_00560 [Candidatus Kapabacteria bacterium]|nr:hypothetical protein [Candidatus Kapabacteria bacterium]